MDLALAIMLTIVNVIINVWRVGKSEEIARDYYLRSRSKKNKRFGGVGGAGLVGGGTTPCFIGFEAWPEVFLLFIQVPHFPFCYKNSHLHTDLGSL